MQRLIEQRDWMEGELDEFWKDITESKGFSVSQLDDNVLCDVHYGPIIIDVINAHFPY